MQKDFKDRTVLYIIVTHDIKSFIVKSKLKFLITSIWDGKDSSKVDGRLSHFSRMQYMLHNKCRYIYGHHFEIKDILGIYFKPNIQDFYFNF